MSNITRAIILTAGYGTRRLPITKALEKCMLPIGDRPLVDYIVEDCILAGITDITFIVGEQSDQIRTYYGANQLLEDYLLRIGKQQQLELITGIAQKAKFHYVVQSSSMPYGTAVPLDLCSFMVNEGDQILVAAGDNMLYRTDGKSDVARLIATTEAAGATAGLLGAQLPPEEVVGGSIDTTPDGKYFKDILENPEPGKQASNLLNASRYIFDKEMFDCIRQVMASPPAANGEYQVTEALKLYAGSGKPLAVEYAEGTYLDGGSTEGWLHANNVVVGGAPLS